LGGPTARTIQDAIQRSAPGTVPEWRRLRGAWSRDLSGRSPREVIQLGIDLVDAGLWERLTAYELITYHPGGIDALTPTAIQRLSRGLADWASVDTFACYLAGPAWREGRLPTRHVHAWLRSTDRWLRRTAVVCTVALNVRARGGRGDAVRTLEVCRRVAADRDDMVVKALSWALRSLVEWDRAAVSAFLVQHRGVLAARVTREVSRKLTTGRKH
jgi:3-methyladenine DNA glycosylase AlkD